MSAATPWPPGAIDQPAEPQAVQLYLDALGTWLAERRHELDRLDQAILGLTGQADQAGPTADLMVALSVWQAVQTRYEALLGTWDSGRVGPVQARQLAQLMWSRLDDAPSGATPAPDRGLSVNLAEACRLSDALTAQLAATVNVSPVTAQLSLRLDGLRAQAERLRDQVALEPAARRPDLEREVDDIAGDTAELVAKAARGGDIGGLIGPLEIRAARFERDLIVGNARRRREQDQWERTRQARQALEQREHAVAGLAAEARQAVAPAPKYAVPHIDSLGPLPAPGPALDSYADRLAQAGRALDLVERANRDALDGLARLRDDLARLDTRNDARPTPDAAALAGQARELLSRRPAPIEVVKPLLAAYEALLTSAGRPS